MCFLKPGNKINKRQGAMNKPTNIVHSGWMIKSPPEQKLQSPLKIFRAKWKKRFFVLHKPSGSLPNQYELSYYNSEECSKKKGSIDLEQCEQIIEDLDSDQYPYLLAIKTFCKGKVRTYYLATDTGEDMGNWVECLCRVCGLKQEDTPTDIPDSRGSTHRMSGNNNTSNPINMTNANTTNIPNNNNNTNNSSNNNNNTSPAAAAAGGGGGWTGGSSPPVTSQPVQASPSRPPRSSSSSSSVTMAPQPQPSGSPQSYVHLTDCTSGPLRQSRNYSRADSSDSVPEYEAPQPPAKKGSHMNHHHHQHHHQHNHNNNNVDLTKDGHADSVFDIYDRPPPSSSTGGQSSQETYDRPRSGTQELYDRPRSGEFRGSHESIDDELYKVPPNHSNPRPRRDVDDLDAPVPLPRPSPRPSSSHSGGRPMTENYDFPPARPDVVDGCLAPPQRPPKPHGLAMQSPYQNLPSHKSAYDSSKGGYDGGGNGGGGGFDLGSLNAVPSAPSKKNSSAAVLSYDVPRATADISLPRDLGELEVAPPVPTPRSCGPAAGPSYLNTVPGLGGGKGSSPPVPPLPETYLKNGEPANLIYADMDATPPPPPPPPTQCRRESDLSYADMSRGSVDATYGNSYMMSRGGDVNGNPDMVRVVGGAEGGGDVKRGGGGGGDGGQDLNQVPPVAPRPPLRSATLPQSRTGSSSSAAGEIENQVIWSNTRTKSFKRNNLVGMSPTPARPPPLEMRVRPPLPVARGDFASTSSEDDEGCYGDGTVKTHHDISVVRMSTVPAAPDFDEPELKYIELAMDTPPDPSRPQAGSYHGTATEYREIDFVKTEALQKTKEKTKEDRSK